MRYAGRALVLCGTVALLAGCAPWPQAGVETGGEAQAVATDGMQPGARTFGLSCGSARYAAQIDGARALMSTPQGLLELPRDPGAKTETYSNGRATLVLEDGKARFGRGKALPAACKLGSEVSPWDAARLSGISFRALGNEPGWVMEIREGEGVRLVTNYGETRRALTYAAPQLDKKRSRAVYRVDDAQGPVEITVETRACTDSMSGERFPARVSVRVGTETLQGCGRALR